MRSHKCGCGKSNCGNCCDKNKGKGITGATGATGATGPAAANNDFLLKFSGRTATNTAGTQTRYLADVGVGASVLDLVSNPQYPIGRSILVSRLDVNLPFSSVPDGSILNVNLIRNGTLVPGFQVVYGGVNPASGIQSVIPVAPTLFSPGDTLDLQTQLIGPSQVPINVSATLIANPV